jgi:hypothetical protein
MALKSAEANRAGGGDRANDPVAVRAGRELRDRSGFKVGSCLA